jgi:hypothetical protein
MNWTKRESGRVYVDQEPDAVWEGILRRLGLVGGRVSLPGLRDTVRFISQGEIHKGFLLEIVGNGGTVYQVILEEWNPQNKSLKYSLLPEETNRLPGWRTYKFKVGKCAQTGRTYIDLTMTNTLPLNIYNVPFTKLGLVETVLGPNCIPIPK